MPIFKDGMMPLEDIVICDECKYWQPINNDDHGKCLLHHSDGQDWYLGDYCSWGEKAEEERKY